MATPQYIQGRNRLLPGGYPHTRIPFTAGKTLSRGEDDYQSNFAPMRRVRGDTITAGRSQLAPELVVRFCTGFAFRML